MCPRQYFAKQITVPTFLRIYYFRDHELPTILETLVSRFGKPRLSQSRPLFSLFRVLNTVDRKYPIFFLLMTWFELWTSGVGSNCTTNWATTTTIKVYIKRFSLIVLSFLKFAKNVKFWREIEFKQFGSVWLLMPSDVRC